MQRVHRESFDGLAALGAFFAVEAHPTGAALQPPWRRLSELLKQPTTLDARVAATRAALAARGPDAARVDLRVAASVTQLGVVARLIAPALGAAALGFEAIDLAADDWWWRDVLGGPVPLSVSRVRSAARIALQGSFVERITEAVAGRYVVSRRVLWGNVGSAANSAARQVAVQRPDLRSSAFEIADRLLADTRVDGGTLRSGASFRRRSCCLIYRVANSRSAACGDCVLSD